MVGRVDVHTFRYPRAQFDPVSGTASFDYLLQGKETDFSFTDLWTFPSTGKIPDAATLVATRRVLDLLYVAVGLAYYAAFAPGRVVLDAVRLAPAARRWAERLYRAGLAEFAYRHDLPHVLALELDGETGSRTIGPDGSAGERPPLVAIGGGKDSIVSIEALKARAVQPVVFAVERKRRPLLRAVLALTGAPHLIVRQVVDRRLSQLVTEHGAYLGHIPLTAINTLAGVVTALLHGLGPVVLSNERSASTGNLVWRGQEVNHQWSKGLEAETLLREAIASQAGVADAYFSLLGGMSELHIAKLVAEISTYDDKMTSCNHVFWSDTRRGERWCNDCAKCRFVFLALAPFMDRGRLVAIFGRDLLDDQHQLEGYRELLGLSGHRPFDCVGEVTESRVAFRLLAERPAWTGARAVRALRSELTDWPSDREVRQVLTAYRPRFAPPSYIQALEAMRERVDSPASGT